MRVTRLQLQGFKSFAAATELDLGGGITAIVGPNGSGKSNLVDAIRLVLGGATARELRGQRLDHVIFAGGERRPPQGMAEVAITFDNEDRRFPVEDLEVALSRRVFRDGGSEFRRNGERVRLRDVYRLLEATGLAQSGYAIIAQNDIEAIIRATPAQRRHLVEEAAGVRGTQALLDESESRMASLDQWLEGSGGRLAELWPRIEELRAEAQLAEEASALQDQIRRLRGGLERAAWLEAVTEARRTERQLQVARRALEQVRVRESEYARVYQQQREELEVRERLRAERERAMGELAVSRQRLEGEATRWGERAVQAVRDRAAALRLQREALGDLEQLGPESPDDQLASTDGTAERLSELEAEARDLEGREEVLRGALARAAAEAARQEAAEQSAARAVERLEGRVELLDTRGARARADLDALRAEFSELERQVGQDQEDLLAAGRVREAAADRLERAIQAEDGARRNRRSLETALEEAQRAARQAAGEVAEAEERAGRRGADRKIAAAARAGELALSPMADVLQPLAPEDAVAVDAALGELATALLGDEEEARRGLAQRGGAAEVVVWAAPSRGGPTSSPPAGCRQLVDAITGSALAVEVVASHLALFCLAADREAAAAWLGLEPLGRAVLPDGTVIGSGWERTPASGGGAMVRAVTLRSLRAERERREELAREAEARLQWGVAQHGNSQAEVDGAGADLGSAREKAEALRSKVARGETALAELGRRIETLDAELASHQPLVSAALTELASAREEQAVAARARAAAEDLAQVSQEELSRLLAQLTDVRAEVAIVRAQWAELQARREAVARLYRERRAQRDRLAARVLAATQGARKAEAAAVHALRRLGTVREELGQLVRRTVAEAGAVANSATTDVDPLARLAELERRRAELNSEVRGAEEAVSRLEAQLAEREGAAVRLRPELEPGPEEEATGVEDPGRTAQELQRLERRLAQLGPVNALAPSQLADLLDRTEDLRRVHEDVAAARGELSLVAEAVGRLTAARYRKTLGRVAVEFESVWRELFGGGRAKLVAVPGAGSELPGVDLEVQPRGKRVIPLGLLSGGERALTALALVLATQQVSPSPFYVFDEVDAALDEVNVGNFVRLLRQRAGTTQFVLVTHSLTTMAAADRLYGVTQDGRGASRVLSVRLGADGTPVEERGAPEEAALV
jgi:chromosome segregation protein